MIRKNFPIYAAMPLILALSACATGEQTGAPAFASDFYTGSGGQILGDVSVDFDNRDVGCLNGTDIFLVPATSENLQQVSTKFGRTDAAAVIQPIGSNTTAVRDDVVTPLYPGAISVRCRYGSRFIFDNVAPGEYFLMTALVMRGPGGPNGGLPIPFGGLVLHEDDEARISLMQRVSVQPSKSTRAKLQYRET